MPAVQALSSNELKANERQALRELFDAAWADDPDGFTDDDWDHAMGGRHFIIEESGSIVAHAAVVERELHAGGRQLATGYVEAVATHPSHQRRGFGSAVMESVNAHIDETFQLGALGTGVQGFYGRLGWLVWKGPTFVRTDSGLIRTAEEDAGIMVRFTQASPELDLSEAISCDWRPGDVW
ncbi:MAG: GNAT family N-acetyltransferase [Actinomycetota bacterium]